MSGLAKVEGVTSATTGGPLSDGQVEQYARQGFLFPVRVLSDDGIMELRQAIDEHMSGGIESERYELTDPIVIRRTETADGEARFEYIDSTGSKPTTFPFLFNLWKTDERFRRVALDPIIGGMARQLLGAQQLLLMEDNAVIKNPHSGPIPWHQDYSYWPTATPSVVTVWIALDHITPQNGAMQLVPGSHKYGERLPVAFRDASSLMAEDRPGVEPVTQDPKADGHEVVTYELQPGECGFHSALAWHASTANASDKPRCAFILRYLASGTIWLGAARFPYHDIGCTIGEPVTKDHFPAVPHAF